MVFKELQYITAWILAAYHECPAALLAFFLYKGLLPAGRAGNIKRPATGGANGLPFFDGAQTGRAEITERAAALTSRTKPRVPVDICAAMDARLFV
ncbi:Uncharacterized [Syntrophomonas zehnderi OL-4]|uniref:Uncharacterized n=1 Tax=Syntrophomonas zehnderi OL-4 TaxID=690567 RepID=A0A0E4GAQ2_9FIRM|nr:Uncharacterized [Syntrophomonas zehnderi OL-4]